MRETRSEGCHWGKTASGVARIRGEGGAAELRREALLWKEREGEQLVVVVVLEGNASLWWWWWLLLLLLGFDPKLLRSSPGGVGGMSSTWSVVLVSSRGLLIRRVVHVCASTIAAPPNGK